MGNKSTGRNTKLSNDEVEKVIALYKENEQPSGIIKYSDIHRYSNKLYADGIISSFTSDAFWRKEGRLGRTAVDISNQVFSNAITISDGTTIKVPNVVDLVNKKYKMKDELLKHLISMENQFLKTLQREEKLKKTLLNTEQIVQKYKNDLLEVKKNNDDLQTLVFRLFRIASSTNDVEFQRQTDYAMKTMFTSPAAFAEFNSKQKEEVTEDNIVPFKQSEEKPKASSKFRKG